MSSSTPIQNSKSLGKTWTLNAGTSELIPKKNHLKLLTLHLPVCLFLIKVLKFNCHPEYTLKYTSFDKITRCALKWFVLTQRTQNLEVVTLSVLLTHSPYMIHLYNESKHLCF